ncbi:MAG: hypothetical protein M1830_002226 [Pleopsidium flavum]|nr:MAG: hypothetical protein M1830_002226 [Pleopsidium flavum]
MSRIQLSFQRKKQRILDGLSKPEAEYTDLSPKGSVDEGIQDLIQEINKLDGFVTTSSCAGRISVYLEGRKEPSKKKDDGHHGEQDTGSVNNQPAQAAVPGGKGAGGKWLYVSHDPILLPSVPSSEDMHLTKLFGFTSALAEPSIAVNNATSYVRVAFEPMILHVMTASLKHAQRVLAAAINAGFRESGVQSLRNLEDKEACPMVAVRTSGLALESVIGYLEDGKDISNVRCVVSEGYLRMVVAMINQRFEANTERILRFSDHLLKQDFGQSLRHGDEEVWEDADSRRERKRIEGLRKSKDLHKQGRSLLPPPRERDSILELEGSLQTMDLLG